METFDPFSIPPQDKESLICDPGCPSLYVRITPSGRRSWYAQKRVGAKLYKNKLGDCTVMSNLEARIACTELLRSLAAGVHPQEQKRARKSLELRIGEIFHEYYEEYAKGNHARPKETKQSFDNYWGPIANLVVAQLTPEVVRRWVNAIRDTIQASSDENDVDAGKATANKQFNLLRATINWGLQQRKYRLNDNPFDGVQPFTITPKEVYVKPEEFHRLEQALWNNPGDAADAAWISLLTGARKGTVLQMRWENVDMTNGVWVTSSKGKKINRLPLTTYALGILRRRKNMTGENPYVFPAASESGHRMNIQDTWTKIRKEAGLDDIVFHTLRHTALTWLSLNRANAFVVQDIAGHSSVEMTKRYVGTANASFACEEMETAQRKAMNRNLRVIENDKSVIIEFKRK